MPKRIALTKGKFAIVDDQDFKRLNRFNWYYHGNKYAARIVERKTILMHRAILPLNKGDFVDHINGNGLDNRRKNLRKATRTQNLWNMRPRSGKSQFKGVRPLGKGWQARITYKKKMIYLGTFGTEKAAAKAYNQEAKIKFGKFARLNAIT